MVDAGMRRDKEGGGEGERDGRKVARLERPSVNA